MPIIYMHMAESGLLLPHDVAQSVTEGPAALLEAGAIAEALQPNEVRFITPTFWGEDSEHNYLVTMKNTSEAARVHIFPREIGGLVTFLDTDDKLKKEPLRTINVPAHAEVMSIGRNHSRHLTELAGAILYLSRDDAAQVFPALT